jgi:hypothetical protein
MNTLDSMPLPIHALSAPLLVLVLLFSLVLRLLVGAQF